MPQPELQPSPARRKGWLRTGLGWLVKLVLGVLGVILFTTVALAVLVYLYRNDIKYRVVSELGKQLRAETVVRGEVDISFWSTFPYVAIEVGDLRISLLERDARRLGFPLRKVIAIRQLGLRLDLLSLLERKYRVEEIMLDKPILYLARNPQGRWNLSQVLLNQTATTTPSPEAADTSTFYFDLQALRIRQGDLLLEDRKADVYLAAGALNLNLTGRFRDEHYELGIDLSAQAERFKIGGRTYLRDKLFKLNTVADVRNDKGMYSLNQAKAEVGGLVLELNGFVQNRKQGLYNQLKFRTSAYDIRQFFSLLPGLKPDNLQELDAEGIFALDGEYRGLSSPSTSPTLKLSFRLQNGALAHKDQNLKLEAVNLRGSFYNDPVNPRMSYFWLDTVSGRFGADPFRGSFTYTDFNDPFLKLNLRGKFDLAVLKALSPTLAPEAKVSGMLAADIQARGKLRHLMAQQYTEGSASGTLVCRNVTLDYPGLPQPISDLNARAEVDRNRLLVHYAQCRIGTSDLNLKGRADNLIGYLFTPSARLDARLQLESNNLDFNPWIPKPDSTRPTGTETSAEADSSEFLPSELIETGNTLLKDIQFTFTCAVKQFQVFRIAGQNLSGGIQLAGGKLLLRNLSADVFGGRIELESLSGKGRVEASVRLSEVDIHKAFTALPLAGELALVGKSIYGQLTTTLQFSAQFDATYQPIPSTLQAEGDVLVTNGKIVDFKPLQRTILFFKLDRFQNVVFNDLRTHLSIRDNRMYLDGLTIRGDGIELQFYGSHGFDNSLDYRLRLSLLKRNLRNREKADIEAMIDTETEESNPTLSVYVIISGTLDSPKFRLDKQAFQEGWRKRVQREAEAIREGSRQDEERLLGPQDRRKANELIEEEENPPPTRKNTLKQPAPAPPPQRSTPEVAPSTEPGIELAPVPAPKRKRTTTTLPVDE